MNVKRLRGAREMPLFPASPVGPDGEAVWPGDGDIRLHRGWLARDRADALLETIRTTTVWRRERRTMYDSVVDIPREQAWYGEGPPDLMAGPMQDDVALVRSELESLLSVRFAYVLFNRYRDGNDSVAWHSDREAARIVQPVIALLTLGATRAFDVREKATPQRIVSVDLDHRDLLVMSGASQATYEHRVSKLARRVGERISLTYRQRAG